jgi:membrane protein
VTAAVRPAHAWAPGALGRRVRRRWRRAAAWGRIWASALRRFWRDDGDALSGSIAYSAFLAIFPFAIFATALAGAFVGAAESAALIDALFDIAPAHVAMTLEPVILGVVEGWSGRLLTGSALIALWSASNAMETVRLGVERAYAAPAPRGFLARRAVALGYVLLAVVTFGALGALIVAAPLAIAIAEARVGVETPVGLGAARYALGAALFAAFLLALHRGLPARRPRRLWPGVAATVLLWMLGATVFSVYLAAVPGWTLTYGALAGVIATLLFFYLTGAAIIFGAEINAALAAAGGSLTGGRNRAWR